MNTVPGPQSAEPGIDTPITGLAIEDIDAGTNIIQYSRCRSHTGSRRHANGGAAVAGNGTNTVVVSGALPGINATLAATGLVVYRSAAGFVGTDMLIMTTTDEANASDTDAVAINVGGQAPTGIVLSGTAINEFSPDGTLVGSLAAIDPDPAIRSPSRCSTMQAPGLRSTGPASSCGTACCSISTGRRARDHH